VRGELPEHRPAGPEVMLREAARLASDLRELAAVFDREVRGALAPAEWAAVGSVYLTGDGDSYHASCAAEMAFETIGGVTCEPLSAQRFLEYGADWLRAAPPDRALVVGTSASGGTQRVVQALERAAERGALTLAVTGTPGSPVTKAAGRAAVVEVPDRERSPGIRTYQASLLGLLLIAVRLGGADAVRHELAALAGVLDATGRALAERSGEVAELVASAPATMLLGSGPSYGTALFGGAKLVEAAGFLAVGQDLEEWWHVERFCRPFDMPLFVIAPPGRSRRRAGDLAARASGLGRRVVAVAHEADAEVARHAAWTLPVRGEMREELSPLAYHLFASHVAAGVAARLGRLPFQAGPPAPGVRPPGTS
jgi:glucosamine--fructose-6-phosphate aminotransferase (isomerizing)